MDKQEDVWSLLNAKAKLSEVIDRVENGDEQIIMRHGKRVARIVPYATDSGEEETGQSLIDFFNRSPLRGSGLKIKRSGKVSLKARKLDL